MPLMRFVPKADTRSSRGILLLKLVRGKEEFNKGRQPSKVIPRA